MMGGLKGSERRKVITDSLMPPFGVAMDIAPHIGSHDLFSFWILTHQDNLDGWRFWVAAVLREVTPSPDEEPSFVCVSPPFGFASECQTDAVESLP